MARARFSTFEATLAAGETITVHRSGEYVRCIASAADFLLGVDGEEMGQFGQGLGLQFEPGGGFTHLKLENPTDTAITLRLAMGTGQMQDSRASFADAIPVGAAPHLVTGPDVSVPAGGAALLKASNRNRREIMIQNRSSNAREIRIGDSDASAAEGIELQPGETWRMAVTGDVWAYNPHTADAVVVVAVITG